MKRYVPSAKRRYRTLPERPRFRPIEDQPAPSRYADALLDFRVWLHERRWWEVRRGAPRPVLEALEIIEGAGL